MKISRTIRTALRALRRNPMRAILTALGIVIGVGAVIAMMELGTGSSVSIQKSIASMGADNLLVLPGTAASGGISFGAGSVMTLTAEDCEAIRRECAGTVRSASPIVRPRLVQVVYGNRNWVPSNLYGTSADFLDVRDWTTLAEGAMFTERDERAGNRVCVVGQTIVRELFGGQSPVATKAEIRIQNVSFTVVGVLAGKGANVMGMDQDDVIIAPWKAIRYRVSGTSSGGSGGQGGGSSASSGVNSLNNLYPSKGVAYYPAISENQAANTPLPVRFANVDQIMVRTHSTPDIPEAMEQITDLLRERHRIRADEVDDFNLRDMTEMRTRASESTAVMTNLLLWVAVLSLLVGGVGIMNIMLVSVTERTREIGLRMAVGARSRDILRQFLIEAVVLCLVGGILGIIGGHGGAFLMSYFKGWPVLTSPAAIVAAIVVSATVGIVFGFYPAWRASRLDPIEALRYE